MPDHYELREYLTATGQSPFADWLNRLRDRRARAQIRARLDRATLGHLGDCEPVGEGVYELRIFYGPGYRVYFGREGEAVLLLLCGGTKPSQRRDIARAHTYWRDYRRRDDAEKPTLP